MKNKSTFVYTKNQSNLRNVNLRMRGLNVQIKSNHPDAEACKREYIRMEEARADILTRMSQDEIDSLNKHENPVLTAAEKAAEAKALTARMEENKDKVSI
jgi:hypothetical protein